MIKFEQVKWKFSIWRIFKQSVIYLKVVLKKYNLLRLKFPIKLGNIKWLKLKNIINSIYQKNNLN